MTETTSYILCRFGLYTYSFCNRLDIHDWAACCKYHIVHSVQDDFDPWPPRLVVQTSDPSAEAIAALPAPVAAVLLRHSKLGASGLEIMEFENMDSLRAVARRLAEDLGPGIFCNKAGSLDTQCSR